MVEYNFYTKQIKTYPYKFRPHEKVLDNVS